MTIYTSVDESYDVTVYRTLKEVASSLASTCLYVVPDDEFDEKAKWVEASEKAISRALRKYDTVRLTEEEGDREWYVKIQKHVSRH